MRFQTRQLRLVRPSTRHVDLKSRGRVGRRRLESRAACILGMLFIHLEGLTSKTSTIRQQMTGWSRSRVFVAATPKSLQSTNDKVFETTQSNEERQQQPPQQQHLKQSVGWAEEKTWNSWIKSLVGQKSKHETAPRQ